MFLAIIPYNFNLTPRQCNQLGYIFASTRNSNQITGKVESSALEPPAFFCFCPLAFGYRKQLADLATALLFVSSVHGVVVGRDCPGSVMETPLPGLPCRPECEAPCRVTLGGIEMMETVLLIAVK